MHRPFSYSSCEMIRGSMRAVDTEWMLSLALVKQLAMAVLPMVDHAWEDDMLLVCCWHAAGAR